MLARHFLILNIANVEANLTPKLDIDAWRFWGTFSLMEDPTQIWRKWEYLWTQSEFPEASIWPKCISVPKSKTELSKLEGERGEQPVGAWKYWRGGSFDLWEPRPILEQSKWKYRADFIIDWRFIHDRWNWGQKHRKSAQVNDHPWLSPNCHLIKITLKLLFSKNHKFHWVSIKFFTIKISMTKINLKSKNMNMSCFRLLFFVF